MELCIVCHVHANFRSKKQELEEIGLKYGVSNIRVFGSVARGDETEDSDVDLVMDHHIHKAFKGNILQEAKAI